MRKNIFITLALFLLITVSAVSSMAYYYFFTPKGSIVVTKYFMMKYFGEENVTIKKIEGCIFKKLYLYGIEIGDIAKLPKNSIVRIQKLDLYFKTHKLNGLCLDIFNGRLRLPDSEPVIFAGKYRGGVLEVDVYTKEVSVKDALDLFYKDRKFRKPAGSIIDLSCLVKGTFADLELKGDLTIEKLSQNEFSVIGVPCSFDIQIKDMQKALKVYGNIIFSGGKIAGPKAAVSLRQSRVIFAGDAAGFSMDLNGTSKIEDVIINIELKGTMESPYLKLTSQPPLPEERLLLMLATGKSWKSVESSLVQGKISPDLLQDFMEYFVFGGSGSGMAEHFGISVVSFKYDESKKGIGVKKGVTDKAAVNYGIEQAQTGKDTVNTHTIGGEYKVTENVSVEGSREIVQKDKNATDSDEPPKDQVMVKYKKEF